MNFYICQGFQLSPRGVGNTTSTHIAAVDAKTRARQCRGDRGKKMQYMGKACRGTPASGSCNAQRCSGMFPWAEIFDFRNAWMQKHRQLFEVLAVRLKRRMRSFDDDSSPNVRAFREFEVDETLCAAANLHAYEGPVLTDTWLTREEMCCLSIETLAALLEDETPHVDGSAGTLVFTYTESGLRFLKVVAAGCAGHIHLVQRRGSVWISNASSFRHQAIHVPAPRGDLSTFGDLADISLSVGRPSFGRGVLIDPTAGTLSISPGVVLKGCRSLVEKTFALVPEVGAASFPEICGASGVQGGGGLPVVICRRW